MRKIRAFTLIELLIVMVISAIVFTIAYYAYRTVVTFQLNQTKANVETEQYRTLNKLLENDFMDCDRAVQTDENSIKFISKDKETISYHLGESDIIRTTMESVTDTFHIKHASSYFSAGYLIPEDKLINEMELQLGFHDDPITLHFQKTYATELLINKKIEEQHNELH